MRHVNMPNHLSNRPYEGAWGYHSYNFSSPTKDRVYVKVLRFVEEHPKCSRREIIDGVWDRKFNTNGRSSNSTLFAHLLYADLIDYDSGFKYRITRKGKSLLKKVDDRKNKESK